ncbi:muscle cell intermediate filament protein AV71-like isoform X2 [Octopus sinensis]|uniref:Muscle cell intermediate filament protein AV71-like isoform X2 n=1 Tax=Octopus sinensis TaxID=2607531 RepID=A0A6P7TH40_9MOLL|nr:muscle cell intermediate filament protein AV71-like isoform X2 [Octopus sinensis]
MTMEKSPYRSTVRKISGVRRHPTWINTLQTPIVLESGLATLCSQESISKIKNANQHERKEIRGLNDKLANHIEKVRFLEAENTYFKDLLWNSNHSLNIGIIKNSYHAEMGILKADIRRKDIKLAALQSKEESLEEEVDYLCAQTSHVRDRNDEMGHAIDGLYDDISRQISDSETNQERANYLEKQLARSKEKYVQLANEMKPLASDLRDETTQRLIEAARVKSLENELAFRTDVHALEMKEYRSMLSKMKNQPSLCDIPKADVESMVSDLSKEYEFQLQQITTHLENRYSAQLKEFRLPVITTNADTVNSSCSVHFRSKNKKSLETLSEYEGTITNLRNQMNSLEAELEMIQEQKTKERNENEFKVNELRSEIELLLKQLKDLMDSKLTLETEISTYRKLLDGDDNRKNLDEIVIPVHEHQTQSENVQANALGNELNFLMGRIKVERTTKGTVSIIELDPDGKYIELKDKSLENATNVKDWTLTQATENGESYTHTFTDSNVFSSSKFIKIWGHKHGSVESGIVSSTVSEWSALSNPSTITLKNNNNKICAAFVSKLVFD